MESDKAIRALSALAHDTRLEVFRRLMKRGPEGMTAGSLAEQLGVPPSTLSHHLSQLEAAKLLRSWRVQRQIFYACNLTGTRDFLAFLTEDCCGGRPEVCQGLDVKEDAMTEIDHRPYNVLFLCTGNSARSIIAEAVLNREGKGKFVAFSAGSQPTGQVNPITLDILSSLDYPTENLRSKSWDEFAGPDAPKMDFVFTVCDSAAGETCPIWPGQPMTAHWPFPDPAAFEGTDIEKRAFFLDVFRQIDRRLGVFVNLPFKALDQLSLQAHLEEMGGKEPA